MNVSLRICSVIALGLAFLTMPMLAAAKPAEKKRPPTLKDVNDSPANFLGESLQVVAWLAPTTKPFGTGSELAVSVDSQSPPSRIHFLVPVSLAAAVADLKESRRVRIAGTLLAAETVRVGYVFEVDEIAVLDDSDKVVATLKPIAGPMPTVVAPEPVPVTKEKELPKPTEAPRKGGVPTVLIVGASLMAALLVVLAVIGVRLLKYMKHQPKPKRRVPLDSATTETVEA